MRMTYLINTYSHWDEPPRARHQVAFALAKKNRVIFVAANKPGLPQVRYFPDKGEITVVQPFFPIGNKIRYRIPLINELYQHWLFRRLKKFFPEAKVINFDFTARVIYRYFDDVIFYYNDNLAAISKRLNPRVISRYHEKVEAEVAARARFCVSVTPLLQNKLKAFNINSHEIPLGGPDLNGFGIAVSEEVSDRRPIRVGLVGFISDYSISSDTLNEVLAREHLQLVVIGPVEDAFIKKLKHTERMVRKGTLTGKSLYEAINEFDVAIAPYCEAITRDDQVGVGTGSKMYQYLAVGKPVVIADMAGLKKVSLPSGFLYVAAGPKEFPGLIEQAHQENTPAHISARIEYARENTWEKRMEQLMEIYYHSTTPDR